jgi:hypothetical protein
MSSLSTVAMYKSFCGLYKLSKSFYVRQMRDTDIALNDVLLFSSISQTYWVHPYQHVVIPGAFLGRSEATSIVLGSAN